MAYTENLEHIEQRLADFGLDVKAATEIVLSGGAGFNIGFQDVPQKEIKVVLKQVRALLYSWLYCLDIKDKYSVKVKQASIGIAFKTPTENYRGKMVIGTSAGTTRMGSRSTMILTEAATGNDEWDVMPSEDSLHQEAKLKAAIEGNEDAFPNDGFEEWQQQKQAGVGGVMPPNYDPKNIFPVPKPFVTPAGLKGIDEVVDLDQD